MPLADVDRDSTQTTQARRARDVPLKKESRIDWTVCSANTTRRASLPFPFPPPLPRCRSQRSMMWLRQMAQLSTTMSEGGMRQRGGREGLTAKQTRRRSQKLPPKPTKRGETRPPRPSRLHRSGATVRHRSLPPASHLGRTPGPQRDGVPALDLETLRLFAARARRGPRLLAAGLLPLLHRLVLHLAENKEQATGFGDGGGREDGDCVVGR